MDEASYTLHLVIDDLKIRVSNNSQNVTTYDNLISSVDLSHQSNESNETFEQFKDHYNQIFETLQKIRADVLHIEIQLRNLYQEHLNGSLEKSRWIMSKGKELKSVFKDSMLRFKLIQQNHLHSLRIKHHALEQQSWSADSNAETKEKQQILAQVLEQVQTDMNDNEYKLNSLNDIFSENFVSNQEPPPSSLQTRPQFEEINFRDENRQTETYETAMRKQHLWIAIFIALILIILVLLFISVL